MLVSALLLVVFLVHLVAFAVLGWRRRQGYYGALVVTFALLSSAMVARLLALDGELVAGMGLDELLRRAAWVAAAVSISWTLGRIWRRRTANS